MKRAAVTMFVTSLLVILLAFYFQDKLAEFKTLGLVGLFLINFFGSATVFFPAPAIASVVAGGIVYPVLLVAAVSGVGSALGELVAFALGHSGRAMFFKDHHKFYVFMKQIFKRFGDPVIFFFAFIPNPLFDAMAIFAGMFSYSPIRYFLLVLTGRFLRGIILAYTGSLL